MVYGAWLAAQLMAQGSWLMARGRQKRAGPGPGPGGVRDQTPRAFLGREPWPLSLEPRTMSLEPRAMNH